MLVTIFMLGLLGVIFVLGIRIVRPTHRGLIERLGKYSRFAEAGFNWVIKRMDFISVNN